MSLENEYVLFCRVHALSNMVSVQLSMDGLPIEFSDALRANDPTSQRRLTAFRSPRETGGGSFSTRSPPWGRRETNTIWVKVS